MLPQIIIFGASDTGKEAFQMLRQKYDIIAFSDNDKSKWGKRLFDIPIISPQQIDAFDISHIVIASIYHVEIAEQLLGMGIRNIKVIQVLADKKGYLLLSLNKGNVFSGCIRRKIDIRAQGDICKNPKTDMSKKRKKVLIISYYFPPIGGSPIQRTLKFVKYLYEFGYEPVVLTTEPDSSLNKYIMDSSLLSDIPMQTQIIRIKDDFSWVDVISEEKAQEITEFLYSVSDSEEWMDMFLKVQKTQPRYILPDMLILWANECIRHIEEYIDMREIDLMYSTVPEWSPHLVAYFLKRKYGIKWCADYRDPWASNEDYIRMYYTWMSEEEIPLNQELEKILVKEMDSIILAGGKWKADFVKRYDIRGKRIKEITNGYDESDFVGLEKKTEKNEKFTLCYNGSVTYNRDPLPVLKIINYLIDQNEIKHDEIKWVFNGTISGVYLEKIRREDRYHIIISNGTLSHKESIQVGMRSDVMVMYGECGEKGYLNYPGKFYEYLRIGRPILCFSSDDSFQSEVLKETGLGINMDLHDSERIKVFLRNQLDMWREGCEQNINVGEYVWRYERRNLTRNLAEEFDQLSK